MTEAESEFRSVDTMDQRSLSGANISSALEALASRLGEALSCADHAVSDGHTVVAEIELLLVGGAAGLLSGSLRPDRTTTDCDVALYRPAESRREVERAAALVAADLGLSPTWLNPGGTPWIDCLPDGWTERTVTVFACRPLVVHAIGRFDMLILKLLAGRAQDIEDLEVLAIARSEAAALREHLLTVSARGWPVGAVEEALLLLDALVRIEVTGARSASDSEVS